MTDPKAVSAQHSLSPQQFAETAAAIEEQVSRVIVGQHDVIRTVIVALVCEGHVLLEGVPGLGKTKLLTTLSNVLSLSFGRIQFTPDLMPADVTGTQVLNSDDSASGGSGSGGRSFVFRPGPVFNGMVLADEINRATPKTQSALLEAMAERSVTVAGTSHALDRPFLVMATQNPIEQEGTCPLPEAQLDRFMFKAEVPFPSADDLVAIVSRTTGEAEAEPTAAADAETLNAMIRLTRTVPVPTEVARHAVDLVVATHPDQETAPEAIRSYVRAGASPRGAQALILGSKAMALLDGRPSASAEDVRSLAAAALGHRLVLGYEAAADGKSPSGLIDDLLDEVKPLGSGVRGAP